MTIADDLRDTLLVCREQLAAIDAHPIYVARIRLIWIMVQEAIKQNPEHWQAALERAERIVDSQITEARR